MLEKKQEEINLLKMELLSTSQTSLEAKTHVCWSFLNQYHAHLELQALKCQEALEMYKKVYESREKEVWHRYLLYATFIYWM